MFCCDIGMRFMVPLSHYCNGLLQWGAAVRLQARQNSSLKAFETVISFHVHLFPLKKALGRQLKNLWPSHIIAWIVVLREKIIWQLKSLSLLNHWLARKHELPTVQWREWKIENIHSYQIKGTRANETSILKWLELLLDPHKKGTSNRELRIWKKDASLL